MSNMIHLNVTRTGDAVLAASRQVWLATLGAAAVTREWAEQEAGAVFRTLVKEGSAVESQAIRRVGKQMESSVKHAAQLIGSARNGVKTSVQTLTGAASAFVRKLPAIRASAKVESAAKRAKPAAKPAKQSRTRAKTRVATTRRTAKSGKSR